MKKASAPPQNSRPAAAIETTSLTKVFRDFWGRPRVTAVDNLNISVPRGSVFGLLGPNGSGKSTTIKMLLGLLRPTTGGSRIMGDAFSKRGTRAKVGYLPETSNLHPFLTPRETLHLYAKLFDLPKTERIARTEQLIKMIGLEKAADRPIGAFSKGMARRVGLAQALINNPDLVILDEPTSGLDPLGRRQVKDVILLLAETGRTVLLCSHLLAEVEDVCGQVAIMHAGQLRAAGKVSDLLKRSDTSTMTIKGLSPEAAGRFVEQIEADSGADVDLTHSAINLERFFLDTVEDATRDRGDAGDGATGGMLADFLKKTTQSP